MITVALAVGIVILVSAICSLLEAVLYSVPASHVENLSASGKSAGRRLQRLRADIQRPISAILSLNTIANTGGAAVAGAAAASAFGADRMVWFSVFFTLAILLLSEIIPKTVGVVFSRQLSGLVAAPLDMLVTLFRPLIWLTGSVTSLIARDQPEQGVSGQELMVMARLGLKTGSIEAHEGEVIANILSLRDRTVHDIMTPRTVMHHLGVATALSELKNDLDQFIHTRIPLIDQGPDDVVGFVHRRDLLGAMVEGRWTATLGDLMRPIDFVAEKMPADQLLVHMTRDRQHVAVVMDDFGGVAGIVTLEDVMEEVLGKEIVDEFDEAVDLREMARRRRQTVVDHRPHA